MPIFYSLFNLYLEAHVSISCLYAVDYTPETKSVSPSRHTATHLLHNRQKNAQKCKLISALNLF